MNNKYLIAGAIAAGALAIWIRPEPSQTTSAPQAVQSAMVAVSLPELSGNAVIGKRVYESACAACHGKNAAGQNGVAPPLVHVIYEPSHHSDEAFFHAAAQGVRSHHWRFGDMPPVEGVSQGEVKMIVAYIRELQRANGIH